jgi:hypothetical protein
LRRDATTGEYADPTAADSWLTATQGMAEDCVAHLKQRQPFDAGAAYRMPAEAHPLAILSALQTWTSIGR